MKNKKLRQPKSRRKSVSREITGVLSKTRPGFGFVIPENKMETGQEDIYVRAEDLGRAMHGDRVRVRLNESGSPERRAEGQIIEILSSALPKIVGTLYKEEGRWFCVSEREPRSEAIEVLDSVSGAGEGDKVELLVTKRPSGRQLPRGRVVRVIARAGQADSAVAALIEAFGARTDFSAAALAEAERLPAEVGSADLIGRRDHRNLTSFTIDGSDARDFDDALSIEVLPQGDRLYVHIADVSHYVREGSELDREAWARGTSIYLPDRVIPMLPEKLSNELCSLKPGADRLTLTVRIDFDASGRVTDYEIYPSVIRSAYRLVYSDISDILEQQSAPLMQRYAAIVPELLRMANLADRLRGRRRQRGSLDFDFDEACISLNDEGLPVAVEIAERRTANRLIEEFMLAANEVVAEHCFRIELPFIYRVHEKPAADKLSELAAFLRTLNFSIRGSAEGLRAKALNDILEQAAGSSEETIVHTVVLRAMKKARYSPDCLGHFGLAAEWYCHFTAPIRRYPDLFIHRMIRRYLFPAEAGRSGRGSEADRGKAAEAADRSSLMERQAEELEREVEKSMFARYMQDRIGETFSGIISSVTKFGFFVQLPNTIEGLVRVDSLEDDHYVFEAEQHRLIGVRRHRVFRPGSAVTVEVSNADPMTREIDFRLISDPAAKR
jgi:ribonuclease R